MTRVTRPSWYDFQQVSKQDLKREQSSYLETAAAATKSMMGTGVVLDTPTEVVIFDSGDLTTAQAGYVAVNAFDGRGVLASPILTSDQSEGNMLAVAISGGRNTDTLPTVVTILGKLFDGSLVYEHLMLTGDRVELSRNHYKEVTNLMFQNLFGNSNTLIDGYGCRDLGATLIVTEVSPYRVGLDLIAAQQIVQPDMVFRNYKVYDSGKTLQTVLQEAIGASNDVDDLDVNTTASQTREFAAGAATDLIYAQKFKMRGDNIQKVSLLLSTASSGTWSGSLAVGIRPLQTSSFSSTSFIPDNEINFDPDTVALEEVAVTAADIAKMGVVLSTEPQVVDFVFTSANLSNPASSKMVDGAYYAITIRRSGSTATNGVSIQEVPNASADQMLCVFDSSVWTDVEDRTTWFQVFTDSVMVSSGQAVDEGYRVSVEKTEINSDVVRVPYLEDNIVLSTASEGAENYVVVQRAVQATEPESHPRTGDLVFSAEVDVPQFSVLTQAETTTLMESRPDLLVLAKVVDNNPRFNPEITGTISYPALARGNTIHVINPSSDLLVQNVIGSIITPNTNKPAIRYRIISQNIYSDLYGDVNGDGVIDIDDVARMGQLDGYGRDLETGSFSSTVQLAAVQNGSVDILEILRADTDEDVEVGSSDLAELNAYLTSGTAFSGGSGFTRVTLGLEPLTDAHLYLDSDGLSTLEIEVVDPDLVDNTSFAPVDFEIEFVPVWRASNVEVTDLRRFSATAFTSFSAAELSATPETGGKNSFFIPGDLYLQGSVKNLDGSAHHLDFETCVIELELPSGDTVGELNLFDTFVVGKMKFSDGTYVSASALTQNQVRFEVSISSLSKNVLDQSDGYGYDGYVDFRGLGADSDEVVGTYVSQASGLLRINAYNIIRNELFPQVRTRLLVTVSLKKAGFMNSAVYVTSADLVGLL